MINGISICLLALLGESATKILAIRVPGANERTGLIHSRGTFIRPL
jgi:hypothetical protein